MIFLATDQSWISRLLADPAGALTGTSQLLAMLAHLYGPEALTAWLVITAGTGTARVRSPTWMRDARWVEILAPPQVRPGVEQAVWAHLHGLARPGWRRLVSGQPHLVWEYLLSARQVRIGVWVPGTIPPGLVEQAISAAWPGAHTRVHAPVPPLLPAGVSVGGRMRLARSEALPLRTEHQVDPLRALLGAAAGLGDATALVQVLARPAVGARLRRFRRAARALRGGASPRLRSELLDLFTPTSGTPRAHFPRTGGEHSAQRRASLTKTGPLWEVLVRYTLTHTDTTSGHARDLRRLRSVMRGEAHAVACALAVHADWNWLARHRQPRAARVADCRRFAGGSVLSVAELAGLAHLPWDTDAAGIARAGAKATPPPPAIPAPGRDGLVKPLGVTDAGPSRGVGLAVADARHHVHIIGATGSGKSTLMGGMILADATAGRGGVVIDPKGDLVDELLARLPERLAGRLALFDPEESPAAPSLNVLAGGGPPDLVTDNVVGVFRRVFASFWGPRTDDVMRSAVLTLLTRPANDVTLADVPRLLCQPAYRAYLVAHISDPVLRGFWDWYDDLSPAGQAQVIGPLMNKLRSVLLRGFVRATIASPAPSLDIGRLLDSGGWVLARLPKGVLGEETARLLGSLIVAGTWQAASARTRRPQHQRPDSGLFIDECHNFLNMPYPLDDMLAESRAYHLALTLAHQDLAQLRNDLKEGISANARSKVIFSASPEDARVLARHTAPVSEHDLAHLGAYQAVARLVVDGAETPAFTLHTSPLPPAVRGRAGHLRQSARTTYGTRPTTARSASIRGGRDPRQHLD